MTELKKELYKLVGNEYELLSTERRLNSQNRNILFLTLKHNNCGKEFTTRKINFFGEKKYHLGNRCPFCSHGHIRKTISEFKSQIKKITNDEYEVVSDEYLSNKKPIRLLHKNCGLEFDVRPDNFLNGTRCPHCKVNSKGEAFIREYFLSKGIEFKSEFWFDSCRDKYPLPFDFAVFKDGKFCCLIEYHGIQHFQEVGKSPFATQSLKDHDLKKASFCLESHIPLYILSYKDMKNKKLEKKLNEIISTTIPFGGEIPQ